MKAIVYTSASGFTAKYAHLLANKTGLPVYDLRAIKGAPLQAGDSVLYLGWLMAGSIKGYKKAAKLFDVRAVCAVGMGAPGTQTPESLKQQNAIRDIPVFYLQGGFDIRKLHGLNRFLMSVMSKTVGKKLTQKPDKTAEEADMLDMMQHGGDRVSEANLAEVLAWLNR